MPPGSAGGPACCRRRGGAGRWPCSPATARLAGLAYGLLLNLSFWPFATGLGGDLSFVAGAPVAENLRRFLVFGLATSLGWDIGRAVTTAGLVAVTGRAVLGALRRAARRAAFEAPVTFAAPAASPARDRAGAGPSR